MTVTVFVVALLALLLLVGCYINPPIGLVEKPKIHGENIPAEKILCILNALAFFPENVQRSLEEIHLRSDLEHFEYLYLGKIKRCASGHNCTYGGRKVCLRPELVDYKLVWHEVAHVYTLTLKNSKEFLAEWEKIAGDVYVPNYEDYLFIDPWEGLLTWYCRKDVLEDIAEWVDECLDYLYANPQNPVFKNPHFKTDKRYRQKLACLKKYGLIRASDYKKLKPLFE